MFVLFSVCVCSPTLSTVELATPPTPSITEGSNASTADESVGNAPLIIPTAAPSRRHRGGKAIGQPPPNPATVLPYLKVSIAFPLATGSDMGDEGPSLQKELALNLDYKKPPRPTAEVIKSTSTTLAPEAEDVNATEAVTVPVEEAETDSSVVQESASYSNNASVDPTVPNSVVDSNVTVVTNNNTVNDSVVKVVEEETEEPTKTSAASVEISTARALLLETGVGRRAADSDVSKSQVSLGSGGLDAGAVSGICFGILVILGLGGAISLVLYRRRYLNKPQTLNDKCSNPDSSGYIDDSTIRVTITFNIPFYYLHIQVCSNLY